MHISPPDSAAMAVLEPWITLLPVAVTLFQTDGIIPEKTFEITVSMQNEVICRRAGTDTRVVLCAPVVVRPHT